MSRPLRNDLLRLVPSLRAFAFCLMLDHAPADECVHSTLLELWPLVLRKSRRDLRVRAFEVLRSTCLRQRMSTTLVPARVNGKQAPWLAHGSFASAFERLSLPEREAISLTEVWGFRVDQTARICHCDRKTVEDLIISARGKLEETLLPDPDALDRRGNE